MRLENNISGSRMDYGQSCSLEKARSQQAKEASLEEAGMEGEEKAEAGKQIDFAGLCKMFPDVCFVVVDDRCGVPPEYRGNCDTSNFGDFSQISIEISIEVIENLENDFDDIVRQIQEISDDYGKICLGAAGYNYTAVKIIYSFDKELGYIQHLWPEEPTLTRMLGMEAGTKEAGLGEGRFEAFVKNVQQEVLDKLMEVGAAGKGPKSMEEKLKMYQDQFVYL